MAEKSSSSWPGLAAGASFGTFGVLALWARHSGLSVPQVLSWRFVLACGLLLLLRVWSRPRPRPALKDLGLALLLGATLFSLQAYTFLGTISRLGAGLATVLLYVYPALVALAQLALGGPGLGRHGWSALLLAFLGTALVGLSGDLRVDGLGVLLGFGTAVIYALYLLLSERLLRRLHPVDAAGAIFAAAGAVCLGVVQLGGEALLPPTSAWPSLSALALLSTVLPVLLLMRSMQALGSARSALLCTVEPVVAMLLGAWLLAERPLPLQWAGSALVLAGVIWLQARREQ